MKVSTDGVTVYINPKAKEKMEIWVDLADGEVSGFGIVKKVVNGFYIEDIVLPIQKCTGSNTDIEAEDVAKILMELEASGHKPEDIKMWWHSHADMGVFWSATDNSTQNIIDPEDFFISIVTNKKKQMLTKIIFKSPVQITFDEVPTVVVTPKFGQEEACKALFTERVSEKTYGNGFQYFDQKTKTWQYGKGWSQARAAGFQRGGAASSKTAGSTVGKGGNGKGTGEVNPEFEAYYRQYAALYGGVDDYYDELDTYPPARQGDREAHDFVPSRPHQGAEVGASEQHSRRASPLNAAIPPLADKRDKGLEKVVCTIDEDVEADKVDVLTLAAAGKLDTAQISKAIKVVEEKA